MIPIDIGICHDDYFIITQLNVKPEITRMKGLGEMDPDELDETTMNIETRTLKRITVSDAMSADNAFSRIMGEEVEPRLLTYNVD